MRVGRGQRGGDLTHPLLNDGPDEIGLGAVVVVDRLLRDARPPGDLVHGGQEAALPEGLGGGVFDPEGAGRKAFAMLLNREALVLAFGDAFFVLAAGCAVAAVLALFAAPAKAPGAAPAGGGH